MREKERMNNMNQPLGYLKEILSNYTDRSHVSREIYSIIRENDFTSEEMFITKLSAEQIGFLNEILPNEMNHAEEVDDYERLSQLNEVYEQLY